MGEKTGKYDVAQPPSPSSGEPRRSSPEEPASEGGGFSFSPADLVALAVDAARGGDTDTLTRALAAGMPVNSTSPRGDSLLMLACYYGHTGAVQLLLDKGADANQPDGRGQSPLSGVAFKGLIDVAELLVAGGALVDASSADGRTPLMMAAAFNRVEMVAWLLKRGAADARDATGLRAIDVARAMGANDVVSILS